MLTHQQDNRLVSDDISTAESAIADSHQSRSRLRIPPNPSVRSHCATAQSSFSAPSTKTIRRVSRRFTACWRYSTIPAHSLPFASIKDGLRHGSIERALGNSSWRALPSYQIRPEEYTEQEEIVSD
jgi:hypothetical protein